MHCVMHFCKCDTARHSVTRLYLISPSTSLSYLYKVAAACLQSSPALRPILQSYTPRFKTDSMPGESSGVLTSFVQKTFEYLYESYDPNEEPEFLDSLFAHKTFPEKSALQAELEAELCSGESNKAGLDIRINHQPVLFPGLKDYLARAREGGSLAKVLFKDVFEVPEVRKA